MIYETVFRLLKDGCSVEALCSEISSSLNGRVNSAEAMRLAVVLLDLKQYSPLLSESQVDSVLSAANIEKVDVYAFARELGCVLDGACSSCGCKC